MPPVGTHNHRVFTCFESLHNYSTLCDTLSSLYLLALLVMFCCAFYCRSVRCISELGGTLTPALTTAMKLLHRLPRSCQGHNPMKLGSRWFPHVSMHVLHMAFIGKNHAALLTLCFAHFGESKVLALCDKWQGSGKPRSMGPCQKVFTTMALGGVR